MTYDIEQYKINLIKGLFWSATSITLYNIPKQHKTEELCKFAVEIEGFNIKFVPEEYLTEELCEIAVITAGNSHESILYYIPDKFKTKKICNLAFANNKHSLFDMPKEFITDTMLINAACRDITAIPDEYLTEELCKMSVTKHGYNLELIPVELRTEELCNIAISNAPKAEQFAPKGTTAGNNYIMKKALT